MIKRNFLLLMFVCFIALCIFKPVEAYDAQGEIKVAAILLEFADVTHSVRSEDIDAILRSLNNYIIEASYGSTRLTFEVKGWYRLLKDMSYYGYGIDFTDSSKCWELVKDSIDAADPYVDYRAFDIVVIVHAGRNEALTGSEADIWSFAYIGSVKISTSDGLVELGISVVSSFDPMGIFAHELGHTLGLPDLYGYAREDFVGRWCLMSIGCWNGEPPGSRPSHPMAWSKIKLGWLPLERVFTITPGRSERVALNALELPTTGFQALKIPLSGTMYYLVEVRVKEGFDDALPDDGVLISLCDDSLKSGRGIVKVKDAKPYTPTLNDATFDLGLGEVSIFNDYSYKLTVRLLSKLNSAYLIEVFYRASDLIVNDVSSIPSDPVVDDLVLLKASIKNVGNEDAGSFKVHLYIDGLLYKVFDIEKLKAGDSIELITEWRAIGGKHRVRWLVDALNNVSEANEGNNEGFLMLEVKAVLLVKLAMEGMKVSINGRSYLTNATGYVYLRLPIGNYAVEVEGYFIYTQGSRAVFTGWLDGVMSNVRLIKLDRNLELTALYVREHLIIVISDYGQPSGGGWHREGSIVEVAVVSPYGHDNGTRRVFLSWIGDIDSTSAKVSVIVDGPKTLKASWKAQYLCSFIFKDVGGFKNISSPSRVKLASLNREVELKDFHNVWLNRGEWRVVEVLWHGIDVKPTPPPSINIDRPIDFTLNCKVYDIEVVIKDLYGLPVQGAEVLVRLSNNTVVKTATGGDGRTFLEMVPYGEYIVKVVYLGQTHVVKSDTETSTKVEVKVVVSIPLILTIASIVTLASISLYLLKRRH